VTWDAGEADADKAGVGEAAVGEAGAGDAEAAAVRGRTLTARRGGAEPIGVPDSEESGSAISAPVATEEGCNNGELSAK